MSRQVPYDVIVVGAGPAGSSLAISLASAGRSVLLLEKDRFPRDKVCGDFVSPRGLALLGSLGCLDEVLELTESRIRASFVHLNGRKLVSGRIPQIAGLPDFGVAVPRLIFDHVLFRRALAVGARSVEGARVTQYLPGEGSVRLVAQVDGASQSFEGRVVVGADGAQSTLARLSGIAIREARYVMPTLRAYCNGLEFVHGHFFFDESFFPGFGWIFPTGSGQANVGVGAPKELLTKHGFHLHDFYGRLRDRISREANQVGASISFSKERGFPISVYSGPTRYSFERGILIGEAARLVDPISGEGIALALESASIAARVLVRACECNDFSAESLATYDAEIESRFGTELGVADLVVSAVRNRTFLATWLSMFRWMGSTAQRDRQYASQMGGILAGLVPNWSAFSPRLLAKPLANLPTFWLEELRAESEPHNERWHRRRRALGEWPFDLIRGYAEDPTAFAAWSAELAAKQRRVLAGVARQARPQT